MDWSISDDQRSPRVFNAWLKGRDHGWPGTRSGLLILTLYGHREHASIGDALPVLSTVSQ